MIDKSHHEYAAGIVATMDTKSAITSLRGRGLTKSQAHDVVAWQRKKAKLYKPGSGRHFVNINNVVLKTPEEKV